LIAATGTSVEIPADAGVYISRPPLRTCEPVLSEACFLLRSLPKGRDAVLELVDSKLVVLSFSLGEEIAVVRRLMRRYADVPMSLADACLVRMCELDDRAAVMTLDSDFRRYRKHGQHVIAVVSPDG